MSQEDDPADSTLLLASAEDLAELDLGAVLADLDRADPDALEKALRQAAETAEERGAAGSARALRLLAFCCTFHLRVEDQAEIWGPRWQSPGGRSYKPSDFRGRQTAILAEFAAQISHPGLRARVADIVWYNDRAHGTAALLAIDAYAEIVRLRVEGAYRARVPELVATNGLNAACGCTSNPSFDLEGYVELRGQSRFGVIRSKMMAASTLSGVTSYASVSSSVLAP